MRDQTPLSRLGWFALVVTCLANTPHAEAAGSARSGETPTSGSVKRTGRLLVAGPDGAIFTLGGGTRLDLSAGARFELGTSSKIELGPPTPGPRRTRSIKLLSGDLKAEVGSSGTAILVRGPRRISAIARDGDLRVAVRGSDVAVYAGAGHPLIAVGESWRPLKARVVRAFASDGRGSWRAPAAPSIELSSSVALVSREATAQTRISWKAVPRANRYRVTLKRSGQEELRTTTGTELVLEKLKPGRYRISVQSFDRFGFLGQASAPVSLNVVQVVLPEGGVAVPGEYQLPPYRSLKLAHAEGLRVTFNRGKHSIPAPRWIPSPAQPTLVTLFAPGAASGHSFFIAPRTIETRIRIGPGAAVWPDDRVTISVVVTGGRGRPAPVGLRVEPEVRINSRLVKMRWRRRGTRLTARVPRPDSAGPWVIRVNVLDQHGNFLGRDHLEVTSRALEKKRARARRRARGGKG